MRLSNRRGISLSCRSSLRQQFCVKCGLKAPGSSASPLFIGSGLYWPRTNNCAGECLISLQNYTTWSSVTAVLVFQADSATLVGLEEYQLRACRDSNQTVGNGLVKFEVCRRLRESSCEDGVEDRGPARIQTHTVC